MSNLTDLCSQYSLTELYENPDLYIELLRSTLVVPFVSTLEGKTYISTIKDISTNIYLPLYSESPQFLRENKIIGDDIGLVEIDLNGIYSFLETNPTIQCAVLDPYSINLILSREFLKNLINFENMSSIKYGLPSEDISDITDKLSDIFLKIEEVREGYLVKMISNRQESYLLVLGLDTQSKENIFHELSQQIAINNIQTNFPIDMTDIGSELGQDVKKNYSPFYIK